MMKRWVFTTLLTLAFGAVGTLALGANQAEPAKKQPKKGAKTSAAEGKFQDTFKVDKSALLDKGSNTYMILEPGYKLTLVDGKDTLTITVLDETKEVDGVKTRIVEERETKGGKLEEVSRNYFAFDKATGDIYYFGEDVDMYDADGKVKNHEGSWLSGVNGARFGLMMAGKPKVGDRYQQEVAPGVAMDRAEVISLTETVKVPAGAFKNCLKTKDSSAWKPPPERNNMPPASACWMMAASNCPRSRSPRSSCRKP